MRLTARIIRPASLERPDLLHDKIEGLESLGLNIIYKEMPKCPTWPISSSSTENRLRELLSALNDDKVDYIWCARGGYGVSDILSMVPWKKLRKQDPKTIIGFSDISALHSAFYTQLGWVGLHAPMPATVLWPKKVNDPKTKKIISLLKSKSPSESIAVKPILTSPKATINGILFGGCLSVLSNLIGTPYFPKSLKGHIIFLEDTNEGPGALMRMINQWIMSGSLHQVKAIILGSFRNTDSKKNMRLFAEEVTRRANVPCFTSDEFGHIANNKAMLVGAKATIKSNKLTWTHSSLI